MLAIGRMVQLPMINTVMPIGTASMTKDIRLTMDRKDINWTARTLWVITENMLQSLTPEYMRLSQVANEIPSVQLPLILRNTWTRRMFLHQTYQKLVYPSQDIKNAPENLRESAFHEKVVGHPSSLVHTSTTGEIVHIGRKSHNECAVITMIGNRSQKALWDSGAGRCIISYDCYNSHHPRYRTELFPSNVRISAANGTFIANRRM